MKSEGKLWMNVHAASAMNKNEIADKPEKKEWNWMLKLRKLRHEDWMNQIKAEWMIDQQLLIGLIQWICGFNLICWSLISALIQNLPNELS